MEIRKRTAPVYGPSVTRRVIDGETYVHRIFDGALVAIERRDEAGTLFLTPVIRGAFGVR